MTMSGRKHLRDAGISERTLRIYKREVSSFFTYLEFNRIKFPKSYESLDARLADYINHLYQEGEPISRGVGLSLVSRGCTRGSDVSCQFHHNGLTIGQGNIPLSELPPLPGIWYKLLLALPLVSTGMTSPSSSCSGSCSSSGQMSSLLSS